MDLGFIPFDADNHYYEATDAFTRHIPADMAKRCMQWATLDGRERLLVGGRVNRFIPNPTFDPVSKPGALDAYFRAKVSGGDLRQMFGDLDPINPAYRDRDARIALMDEQGLDGAFFFPTLGVGMEESLKDDVPAMLAAFRAFNRWLDDDWGFAYRSRIFAAPYFALASLDWALAELDWAISKGVRVIVLRMAPALNPAGGTRSPGDPMFDPFWAKCATNAIVVAFHSGDSGYGKYVEDWEPSVGEFQSFKFSALRSMASDRAAFDVFAALVCHGVLGRHPELRLASIEAGSEWVAPLVKKLKKAYVQLPFSFTGDPVEQLRRQLWVAPFYEDDIRGLADNLGVEHVLFGSDFPHAEGLADPLSFVNDLHGFTPAEVQLIMRDNARNLVAA